MSHSNLPPDRGPDSPSPQSRPEVSGAPAPSQTEASEDAPPSPVVIVRLRENDWRRNRDLRLELLSTDGWAFGAHIEHEREVGESEWRRRLAANRVFAAVRDGRDVGIAALRPIEDEPATLKLISVWVEPGQRGRANGVSDALIDRCIREARAAGAERLLLGVRASNVRAQRLYERHGFRMLPADATEPGAASPVNLQMVLELRSGV